MFKEALFGKTLEELQNICQAMGLPKFAARQITDWLYKKPVFSINEMSNLSKKARELLDKNYCFGTTKAIEVKESIDGTKKYLFPVLKGNYFIETAMIPERNRNTVCISSQAGCKMNCLFCMTGKQGFQGNLSAGEILNQLRSLPEWEKISNIVYMGMGEPMDNLTEVSKSINILTSEWGFAMSPHRITVSSSGVLPPLIHFLDESLASLAISLNSPFSDERAGLMPIEKTYPIAKIIEEIKKRDFHGQRRVSFEYIVFHNINDSPKHVKGIALLLKGLKCRINLIRFHTIPGTKLNGTDEKTLQTFKDQLNETGVFTTIRASRGQDIEAACGLLSTIKENKDKISK